MPRIYENLMNALAAAKDAGEEEFEYDGETYRVSDFDDEEGDAMGEEMDFGSDEEDEDEDEEEMSESNWEENPDNARANKDVESVKAAGNATKKAKVQESRRKFVHANSVIVDVQNDLRRSIKEDINALFNGEKLTNKFKAKATAIFENAVGRRVEEIARVLEEEANHKISSLVEERVEDVTSQIDDYLTYVAEEWKKENQIAIDRGIRTDIAESFMAGLKTLFEAHHIDMPQEKIDVLGEQQKQIKHLQVQLNEAYKAQSYVSSAARKATQVSENKARAAQTLNICEGVIRNLSTGLAETQVEKLRGLAEGVDFNSPQEFAAKLKTLKESYFSNKKRSKRVLEEEDTHLSGDDTDYMTPSVAHYARFLSSRSEN
jgi:hypothetical protein